MINLFIEDSKPYREQYESLIERQFDIKAYMALLEQEMNLCKQEYRANSYKCRVLDEMLQGCKASYEIHFGEPVIED